MVSRIALLFFLLAIGPALANEPGWTPQQRADNRQAVITAEVQAIDPVSVGPDNKNIHLMRVRLKITSIEKGRELVGDTETCDAYYETSPLGTGSRCPSLPVLKVGESSRFYLRYDTGLTEQKAFVIEMGSDVSPVEQTPDAAMP